MQRVASLSRPSSALRDRYGPTALVTGASEGIGRAFALELAGAGFDLVLVARREAVLTELAQDLRRRYAVEVRVLAADLSDPEQVRRVERESVGLDIGLFIAAAGFGTSGPFVDGDPETELNMLDLNCRALAQTTQVFARRFVERGRGGIVLMSSLLAFQGVPGAANYGATKAYVQTLAEGLHAELKPRGVDVLSSAPGPVMTGFARRATMRMTSGATPKDVAASTLKALGRRATVRPGLLAKVLEASLKPLPRFGRVFMMGRIMAGMTAR